MISLTDLDAVIQEVLEQCLDATEKEIEDLKSALLDRLQIEFDIVDDSDEEDDEDTEEPYGD